MPPSNSRSGRCGVPLIVALSDGRIVYANSAAKALYTKDIMLLDIRTLLPHKDKCEYNEFVIDLKQDKTVLTVKHSRGRNAAILLKRRISGENFRILMLLRGDADIIKEIITDREYDKSGSLLLSGISDGASASDENKHKAVKTTISMMRDEYLLSTFLGGGDPLINKIYRVEGLIDFWYHSVLPVAAEQDRRMYFSAYTDENQRMMLSGENVMIALTAIVKLLSLCDVHEINIVSRSELSGFSLLFSAKIGEGLSALSLFDSPALLLSRYPLLYFPVMLIRRFAEMSGAEVTCSGSKDGAVIMFRIIKSPVDKYPLYAMSDYRECVIAAEVAEMFFF